MNPVIKATLVGTAVNLTLSIIKFIGGIVGSSAAMVADAIHSVSDLLTDAIVLFTHKISKKPKDEDHPYGHGRAETLGTTAIGLFIISAGIGLAYEAWEIIQSGSPQIPNALAAGAALISIAINEWLFHYTRSVGEKSNSPTLIANAWHHRSDAISSIAALIGIVGAMIGFPLLDPIAAVMVAFMVIKIGYEITLGGFRDLMDTSLSEEQIGDIQIIINDVVGVIKSHDLRTRKVGGNIVMDVHIQVDNDLTVTEGHEVAERVRRKLLDIQLNIQDVLVHVDGYDDSQIESIHNVSRNDIKLLINPIISNMNCGLEKIKVRVHHLSGKNFVELYIRRDSEKSITKTEADLEEVKENLLKDERIDGVKLYLEVGKSDYNHSIK